MEGIDITDDLVIPGGELEWRFSTSGGPGGQHANRNATRAILRWDVLASDALRPSTKTRLLARLSARLDNGILEVAVQETRSQWRNRQIARSRLATLVRDELRPVSRPRRRTHPTARMRRYRLKHKRRRAKTKQLRRPPQPD